MTEIRKVSNSELITWKSCRRRWWLTYYRNLEKPGIRVTGALALGSRVHGALESYYTFGTDPVYAYVELLNKDRDTLMSADMSIEELESEGSLGLIMVEGFKDWLEETGADSEYEVISAESIMEAPINDRVTLRGKTDLRVRRVSDDAIKIMDFKTSKNFNDLKVMAHMSEQFLTYSLLEWLNPPEDGYISSGGIYRMLKKVKRGPSAKPPFYEDYEVRFNKTQVQSFWTRIHGEVNDMLRAIDMLEAGADHQAVVYPTPTKDCSWICPFFHACSLFDDGSAAEAMIGQHYTVGNPNERYDLTLTPVSSMIQTQPEGAVSE